MAHVLYTLCYVEKCLSHITASEDLEYAHTPPLLVLINCLPETFHHHTQFSRSSSSFGLAYAELRVLEHCWHRWRKVWVHICVQGMHLC